MDDHLSITAQESGARIDALLARCVEDLSRSAAQRLLDEGRVLLDGRPVKKNYKCAAGDCFTLTLPDAAEVPLIAQDLPLDVVYEDGDVIVVNKPRGMVVHPAPGTRTGPWSTPCCITAGTASPASAGRSAPALSTASTRTPLGC